MQTGSMFQAMLCGRTTCDCSLAYIWVRYGSARLHAMNFTSARARIFLLTWRAENGIAQALHSWRFRRAIKVEDDDFVVALAQPGCGQEQALLRAHAPITAEVMAVDPHMALAECTRVEEGAAVGIGAEMAAPESGAVPCRCPALEAQGRQVESIDVNTKGKTKDSWAAGSGFVIPL